MGEGRRVGVGCWVGEAEGVCNKVGEGERVGGGEEGGKALGEEFVKGDETLIGSISG